MNKGKNKKIIILIVVIFILLILGISIYFIIKYINNKEINIDNNTITSNGEVIYTQDSYNIVLYDDIYYLVYDNTVLDIVNIKEDIYGDLINNSIENENVYVLCFNTDVGVSCGIGEKLNDTDNYGIYTNYNTVTMYSLFEDDYQVYYTDNEINVGSLVSYDDEGKEKILDYTLIETDSNIIIFDRINGEVINLEGYTFVGDSDRSASNSNYYTNNSNYIVIKNNETNKYGIIDLKGNIVVDTIYDELKTISNHNEYIYAKLNGYSGIINYNNEVLVSLMYDDIVTNGTYFVVGRNSMFGIIDNDRNVILALSVNYYNDLDSNFYDNTDFEVSSINHLITINYKLDSTVEFDRYIIFNETTYTITESGSN